MISTEHALWLAATYSLLLIIGSVCMSGAWYRRRIERLQGKIDIYKTFPAHSGERTWTDRVGELNPQPPVNVIRAAFLPKRS